MKITLSKRIAACLVATCITAEPAFAAQTDISNTPLGASAGGGFLPNLLFILDDSGSMASDYNPDYVNDNNTCMNTSGGGTNCQRGDPPFEAGGQNGFNGVGYDPNFTYLPGLTAAGVPVVSPGSTPIAGTPASSSVPPDAYLGGSNVNVTSQITDKRFCNPNNLCKRNGQSDSTGLPVGGTDAAGNTLAAGRLPYRTHASNSSTLIFGLPEMMQIGIFLRNTSGTGGFVGAPTSLVRVTTVEAHGLATGDRIFTNVSNMAVTCVQVTKLDNNNFTYTSGGTTAQNRTGTWRKCAAGTFDLGSNTGTVTSTAHGLVTGDQITTFVASTGSLTVSNVNVTVSTVDKFTFAAGNGSATGQAGFWVRTGLYNQVNNVTGPAIAYSILPIEWCSDVALTTCKEIFPLINPNAISPAPNKPTGADAAFSNPAYVRFCKTQGDALAPSPGAVTGTSVPIPQTSPTPTPATARCQLKFVNQTGLTNYIFPRYGWFQRDAIVNPPPAPGKFTNRGSRTDCVTAGTAPDCTYAEEIANYSRWYAYYRTRMQMMKTSAGRAFLPFISNPTSTPVKPDRLRVGFITINPTFRNNNNNSTAPDVDSSKYLRIDTFNNVASQATNWYNKFYAIIPNNSTPLRLALSRAGWIYAGKLDTGLTSGIPAADDPIQVSCQKNYAFLTTDGFWNQGVGKDLGNNDLGNQDNVNNDSNFPAPNPYIPPASGTTAKLFVSRGTGTYDGATNGAVAGTTPGGSGTLADIAMYYYRTDLRGGKDLAGNTTGPATSPNTTPPNGDVSINNVTPAGDVDFAKHQHMTTFTIGLADGLMRFQKDWATNTTSDYFHIVNADNGACFWNPNATCNWPLPVADGQSALDDLWHAAVNGRGSFYSAVNPSRLAEGLSSALNALDINVASAAAAATSSPQVAQGNALAFSTTYQTATWSGEIYAQKILPTGEVDLSGANNGKIWEGHKLLVTRVGNPVAVPPQLPNPSPRVIKTFDVASPPASASKLKDFTFATLSSTLPAGVGQSEQAQFSGHCLGTSTTPLSQCGALTPIQQITASSGDAMVKFLSGDPSNEQAGGVGSGVFRDRSELDQASGTFVQTVLGDIINSQPVAVGAPFNNYENEGGTVAHAYPKTPLDYSNVAKTGFKDVHQTRKPFVLVGANDGFLHSFDQASGQENWAYVPRFLLPTMYQLADKNYPGQHRFFVDGSPEVADVFDVNAKAWKTIVIGGMNSGGRGFYALDITDSDVSTPLKVNALWEFCSNPTWCPSDAVGPHSDPDLGFSYGNPVIGRRDSDGRWVVVVTSGLNNVSPGDGKGYFYVLDAITGQILHKIRADDGTGSTSSPSGLMKIGAYYPVGLDDPNFTHVFGGDQKGHVWRLDVSTFPSKQSPAPAAMVTYNGPTDITTDAHYVGLLANLQDSAGRIQPITARPAGTHLGPDPGNPQTRIYYVGTGRYLGNSDLTDQGPGGIAWQQTIYGIRDQLDKAPVNGGAFVAKANFRTGNPVQQFLGQSGVNRTITKNPVDWTTQDGFFIDLNPHFPGDPPEGNSPGERVFLDVRLILGTLLITSNFPPTGGACVAGGHSFQYGLDFRTGGYIGNDSTAPAGLYVKDFLVGSAIEQTSDGTLKALNKSITGENLTTPIPTDTNFTGKRFSYRER